MITSCINIFGVTLLAICDALAQTSFVPLIKKIDSADAICTLKSYTEYS